MQRIETIQYETFLADYRPIRNHLEGNAAFDGAMFETYGDELNFVRGHETARIWTLLEGDHGALFIASGFHFVNRLGYFVTEHPAPAHTHIEVELSDHWDIAEDYAEQLLADDGDTETIYAACEQDGAIAASICFHLMKSGAENQARKFVERLAGRVSPPGS